MYDAILPQAIASFNGIITNLQTIYTNEKWKDYVQIYNSSINSIDNRNI